MKLLTYAQSVAHKDRFVREKQRRVHKPVKNKPKMRARNWKGRLFATACNGHQMRVQRFYVYCYMQPGPVPHYICTGLHFKRYLWRCRTYPVNAKNYNTIHLYNLNYVYLYLHYTNATIVLALSWIHPAFFFRPFSIRPTFRTFNLEFTQCLTSDDSVK